MPLYSLDHSRRFHSNHQHDKDQVMDECCASIHRVQTLVSLVLNALIASSVCYAERLLERVLESGPPAAEATHPTKDDEVRGLARFAAAPGALSV